jgi:5-methyltetrahydrofolate--homocysteine methyltransferase
MSKQLKLIEQIEKKIIVFDGAMGTALQARNLTAEDFGGEALEGCNENLNMTRPDVVIDIHKSYYEAGADVVETNSFGSTPLVLDEYGLGQQAFEISKKAAELARQAADEFSTGTHPRFVAGSMGPTTKSITVTGGVTFQQLIENYYLQAKGLLEGNVDVLLLETCQDTRNVKAGILGINQARKELGKAVPLMVSGTIEPMGTMLAGQGVDALYASLEHADLLSIGLNCATGPRFMTDHIRSLASIANCMTSCIPNAGLPDEEGRYNETPDMIARTLGHFMDEGWVNIVGGCCGTTPEYIAAIAEAAKGRKPRQPQTTKRFHISGIDYLEVTDEKRPLLVGERTNVIGSRKFKRLIVEEKHEEASEIGRKQVRNGAHIVDVCLANPDRDELEDMEKFLRHVIRKVKAPLMIDSTDPVVIERALQYSQGKAIINSINLEDGEDRFKEVVPIARKYGAALIVGCIDEDPKQGMAVTRTRKLEVAQRSYELLTNKYGVPAENLIFDPLVFPCATGDENYIGSAQETIEGVRAIKKTLPGCKTILGISNVSFGLPPAGREVLNAVFLYHNTRAGLDMAIVNTEKLERYASISDEEKKLAEDLLFNRGEDPVGTFADFYRDKKVEKKVKKENRTLEERLADSIIEAMKEGLIEDLDEALQKYDDPLDIINGPLMAGMDEVGKLFGANELIVAEVLQSAEVMKTAVAHLEPHMEQKESNFKGTLLLATVKGDVHDIGKNLVDIILSNNGFKVINLGIKIPPEEIIKAVEEHKPDMIGLSGLLVKSAQQMVITAGDLKEAGITMPILVGGAALSNKFTRMKIAPSYGSTVAYATDAMNGLDLANQIIHPDKRKTLEEQLVNESLMLSQKSLKKKETAQDKKPEKDPHQIRRDIEIPSPPDLKPHVVSDFRLEDIIPYINDQMLLGKHLGLKGLVRKLLEKGDEKAVTLKKQVDALIDEVLSNNILKPRCVYQFFPARPDTDAIRIMDSTWEKEIDRFVFPRQSDKDELCLSDWVDPDRQDTVAMFVTTVADEDLYKWSDKFKNEGQLLKSHMLQALALEAAEAFAELLHEKIRQMWGIQDPPELTISDKFKARYRGVRVSFGYPACPRLEDQEILFRLLDVENRLGVKLTDGYMMEPEASVSALVFHHPDARYFNISREDIEAFEENQMKTSGASAV